MAAPNPLVGCVIVADEQIIAEGYHVKRGEPHAEVNAIRQVKDDSLLKQSTLYVNLEPCAHYGKTPPCADLIIEKQIPQVVFCNYDTNPKVNGAGLKRMEAAGIKIIGGVLEEEGRMLNKRFFTYIEKHRPYIILKWAQSKDGFMFPENPRQSRKITNVFSDIMIHRQRSEEAAILVGTNTVKNDNPQLTVRNYTGLHPLRISMDFHQQLTEDNALFDDSVPTLIFCEKNQYKEKYKQTEFLELNMQHPVVLQILDVLRERKIQSLIVEGGPKTLHEFIRLNCWDEAHIWTGNNIFVSGLKAPAIIGKKLSESYVTGDHLEIIFNKAGKSL